MDVTLIMVNSKFIGLFVVYKRGKSATPKGVTSFAFPLKPLCNDIFIIKKSITFAFEQDLKIIKIK